MQLLLLICFVSVILCVFSGCMCFVLGQYLVHRGGSRGGGGALGAEAPPFIFRFYLINMLSIIMKFCLSIII